MKESPNTKEDFKLKPSAISGRLNGWLSGFSHKVFGLVKFILGLILLPFVYSASIAFLDEFCLLEKTWQNDFWAGVVSFILIYLFIWEPARIYTKGQRLLELIFNFFKPLVRVAPYLLPIYTIILFGLYQLLSLVVSGLIQYTLFLLGFSITLHLVFSAKSVRGKKEDFLKANYIFGFSFVYIINLILLAFFLSIIFEKFSLLNFLNNSLRFAKDIFHAVFKQLFF